MTTALGANPQHLTEREIEHVFAQLGLADDAARRQFLSKISEQLPPVTEIPTYSTVLSSDTDSGNEDS
jgi:hypothetical protein